MRKFITISAVNCLIIFSLLVGCLSQSQKSEDNSSIIDSDQNQSLTIFGVSQEIHTKAIKEGEEAKKELETLKKDRNLSATAKRILSEADEALEQKNNDLYLAKIQQYRQLLNGEPFKRAAEAWILEGRVLFSQLRLQEAQQAIEEAVQLDSNNPEYLLILAEYLRWNGDYQTMEEVSLQAITVIKSQNSLDPILLADALSFLGHAYFLNGDYDSATNALQQVLEIKKKLLGEHHPSVATSLLRSRISLSKGFRDEKETVGRRTS